MAIDFNNLSLEDQIALLDQVNKIRDAQRDSARLERERNRARLSDLGAILFSEFKEETFKSGAVGVSVGGKDIPITIDGTARLARFQILVRWEDTIPAKDDDK